MKKLVCVAILSVASGGCVSDDEQEDLGTIQAALGEGCQGLLNAHGNVCPDKPSCHVLEDLLVEHGCVTPAECPCDDNTWNLFTTVNGLYCFAPEFGRLSVCFHGAEVCTANLGGAVPVAVDPALCAACRQDLPVTVTDIAGTGTYTIDSCSEVP